MNTTVYGRFKGVDFSVDASLVDKDRSPYAPNLIADIGGMPEKRLGWRVLHQIEQPVNGIWYGEIKGQKSFIAHGGTKIYKFTALGFEVISLKRVQHGTITLEGLKKGQIKAMKPKHVKELKGYLAKIRREKNA